jgi:uncharacterized protein YjbJ (UPF0337 family)
VSDNPRTDEYKGRAKEALGDLTDDEELQREGKADQASSTVKEKVDKVTDKVKDALTSDDDS